MLRSLGKSVLLYGLASSVSKFVGIFLVPLFTRYYSPEEYGAIDLVSTVISFVAIFGILQLESAISRFFHEADEERSTYVSTGFWAMFLFSSLALLLVIIFSNRISIALFGNTSMTSVFQLASANIILLNIFGYLTVLLRFDNKPLLYSVVVLIQFLITFIVSFCLIVYTSFGIASFFLGQISGLAVGSLTLAILLRRYLTFKIDLKILKSFFNYSLPQVPAVASSWLNTYANRFVILSYLSLSDIGLYTVALKIASIFNLVDNAFRMAWEPFIWSNIKNESIKKNLRKLATQLTIVVFFIALVCMFFAQEMLFILSTSAYSDALPLTKILFYALSFPVLIHLFGIGTSIAKRTIYNTLGFFIGMLCNLGLLMLLVPRYGIIAVPLALATSNMVTLFSLWYFGERAHPIGFSLKTVMVTIIIFTTITYVSYRVELLLITKLVIVFICMAILAWKRKIVLDNFKKYLS